ncbi:MAG: sensor histidine kinase [Flavobacteriales bacterium]|nr:sensor histidine kinase [Flavobacteriales bacterium]
MKSNFLQLYRFCFLIILLGQWTNTQAQDSADVANHFQQLLSAPQAKDSVLAVLDEKSADFTEKSWDSYYYHYSKFLFVTRDFEGSAEIAREGLKLYGENSMKAELAKFYNILGSIAAFSGDYKTCIEHYNQAIRLLELHKNYMGSALIKNNVANIFFSLRDYESAYKYAQSSYQYLKSVADTVHLPSITGIAAISAIKIEEQEQGSILAEEGLELSKKYNNIIGLIVGYHAKGELEQLKENYAAGVEHFQMSLELSNQYRQPHYALLNKMALLHAHLHLENYDLAVEYGQQAWEETKDQKNDNLLYSVNKNLGYAYAGQGKFEQAYGHLYDAHNQYIEVSGEETKKIINDILIKYETEEKEKELAQKKLEVAESENQIQKQNAWIILLSASLIVIVLLYFLYRNRQKQKMLRFKEQQEKKLLQYAIQGEERERKRLSYELHDGIASALTGIKLQLAQNADEESTDFSKVIEQINNLHEDTRRISHNLLPHNFEQEDLVEVIHHYCLENSSEKLRLSLSDNRNGQKTKIHPQQALILYRVFQELINNVRKHAQASSCMVQTALVADEFVLSVEDDGIGFDAKSATFQQGLKSIEERIQELDGSFEVESSPGKGTLAIIRLNFKA